MGFLFTTQNIYAQQVQLNIVSVDDTLHKEFLRPLSLQQHFSDRESCYTYIKTLPNLLIAQGFINASVDSVWDSDAQVNIHLFLGKQYIWENLRIGDEIKEVVNKVGFSEKSFIGKKIDTVQIAALFNKLIDHYAGLGYPFTSVGFKHVQIFNNKISGELSIDKQYIYPLDSIVVNGSAKVKTAFIHKYLRIPPKSPYNISLLKGVDQRLMNLPFLEQSRPWDVLMTNNGAVLQLYLNKKPVNEIDAIVGFGGAGQNTLDRKLRLTGQMRVKLHNSFGGGELIGLDWQQLQPRSPRIKVDFAKPYLMNSSLGVDFNFQLYKLDSAFIKVEATPSVFYELSVSQKLRLLLGIASSTTLSVDTNAIIAAKRLPEVVDFSMFNVGLGYTYNNTDYLVNPTTGTVCMVSFSGIRRRYAANQQVTDLAKNDFSYRAMYDSLMSATKWQLQSKITLDHYWKIGPISVIKNAVNLAWQSGKNNFINEVFQIGGYRLLRGFDDESIFANAYAVGTAEYRYLMGRNSFFFGFVDGGWTMLQRLQATQHHTYISGGIGMAFQTKAGIFNVALGNGKKSGEPFRFNRSKIHIGYTALF